MSKPFFAERAVCCSHILTRKELEATKQEAQQLLQTADTMDRQLIDIRQAHEDSTWGFPKRGVPFCRGIEIYFGEIRGTPMLGNTMLGNTHMAVLVHSVALAVLVRSLEGSQRRVGGCGRR